jgi:hypothetical protein
MPWNKARFRPAIPLALLLAACSSSSPQSQGPKANIPEPQITIEQLHGPRQAGFPYGAFEVQYRFEIQNRADVPLTLKRITLSTVNPEGGPYSLTAPRDYHFNKIIPAKSAEAAEFWARAYGYGRSMRDTEPVTIKGVANFQSPGGYLNKVFVAEIGQLD